MEKKLVGGLYLNVSEMIEIIIPNIYSRQLLLPIVESKGAQLDFCIGMTKIPKTNSQREKEYQFIMKGKVIIYIICIIYSLYHSGPERRMGGIEGGRKGERERKRERERERERQTIYSIPRSDLLSPALLHFHFPEPP